MDKAGHTVDFLLGAHRDKAAAQRYFEKSIDQNGEPETITIEVREKVMRRFKSERHLQRFTSVHDQVANVFMHCRYNTNAQEKRAERTQAFEAWEAVTGHSMLDRLAA